MQRLPARIRRVPRSPWSRLEQMESEIDRWMRGALTGIEAGEGIGWMPDVDLVDANGEFTLTAELPGVKPDDVEVDIDGEALVLRGEKREERDEETNNRRLVERSYGSFERSFTLPRSVDPERVRAEFDNGVLTVHLPKRKEATGRKIEIKTGKK